MGSMPSLGIFLKQQFKIFFFFVCFFCLFFFFNRHVPSSKAAEVWTISEVQTTYYLGKKKKSSSTQSPSYILFPPDFLASLTGDIAGSPPILHKLSVWQQVGHISVQLWQTLSGDGGEWAPERFEYLKHFYICSSGNPEAHGPVRGKGKESEVCLSYYSLL